MKIVVLFIIAWLPVAVMGQEVPDPEVSRLARPTAALLLLTRSAVWPAMATLVGNDLYYTSEPAERGCRGRDLFHYTVTTRKESLVARVPCVVSLEADGRQLFVQRLDEGRHSASVLVDGKLSPPFPAVLPRQQVRIAFQIRLLAQDGRLPEKKFRPLRSHLRGDWVYDLFSAEGTVVRVVARYSVSDVNKKPEFFTLEIPDERFQGRWELAVDDNGTLLLTEAGVGGNPGRLHGWRLQDGRSVELATPESLRRPHSLIPLPFGFLLADRTVEGGAERYVGLFSPTGKALARVLMPAKDVGGLSYVHEGILAAKPYSRQIVWYGHLKSFPRAETWMAAHVPEASAGDLRDDRYPSESAPVGCPEYRLLQFGNVWTHLSRTTGMEVVELAWLRKLQSFDCVRGSLAIVAEAFQPLSMKGHLTLSLSPDPSTGSNLSLDEKQGLFEHGSRSLFVVKDQALSLARRPLLKTSFEAVRAEQGTHYRVWLGEGDKAFEEWTHRVKTDGTGFEADAYVPFSPEGDQGRGGKR